MSVIAVKNFGNKITIGADSQKTRGDEKSKITKLFYNEKSNLIWGHSGYCYEASTYDIFLKTHCPSGATEKEIYEHFLDFMDFKRDFCNDKMKLESDFIIVFQDKAFYVSSLMFVLNIKQGEFEAIGCGFPEAKTALHLGHTVQEAIEITCEVNIGCMKPAIVYEMKKGKVQKLEDNNVNTSKN